MSTLTDDQLRRQDLVDNAVYNLLCELNPSKQEVTWNIEAIGEIRNLIQFWLVERFALTDEMTFYPYVDENE